MLKISAKNSMLKTEEWDHRLVVWSVIIVFLGLVGSSGLLINLDRNGRHLSLDILCPICGDKPETIFYVLSKCDVSIMVFFLF